MSRYFIENEGLRGATEAFERPPSRFLLVSLEPSRGRRDTLHRQCVRTFATPRIEQSGPEGSRCRRAFHSRLLGPQFGQGSGAKPCPTEDRTQKFARVAKQRAPQICAKQTHGGAAGPLCQHARDEAANGANARWQCRSPPSARAGMHPRISCTCLACTDCCCSAPGKQVTHPLFIARLWRILAIYASSVVAQ